jgi:predicted DNA-binding transcriptional regulator AlpA
MSAAVAPRAPSASRRGSGWPDLDDAPIMLTLEEVAAIYRMGMSTIRKRMALRTFTPAPYSLRPLRWRKVDVEADLIRLHRGRPRRLRSRQK